MKMKALIWSLLATIPLAACGQSETRQLSDLVNMNDDRDRAIVCYVVFDRQSRGGMTQSSEHQEKYKKFYQDAEMIRTQALVDSYVLSRERADFDGDEERLGHTLDALTAHYNDVLEPLVMKEKVSGEDFLELCDRYRQPINWDE